MGEVLYLQDLCPPRGRIFPITYSTSTDRMLSLKDFSVTDFILSSSNILVRGRNR